MFEKVERNEIKEINSIPIGYGLLYTIFLSKVEKPITAPKEVIREVNGKEIKETMVFTTFKHVRLDSFAVDSELLAKQKDISILEGLDKNKDYEMDLSPTIANMFMDLVDKAGIKVNQKFLLKKVKTNNKYKPDLKVEPL